MMSKITYIDPPYGWLYGFPKPYTPEENETCEQWLVKNGYPQELIDKHGSYFHCGFWEQ